MVDNVILKLGEIFNEAGIKTFSSANVFLVIAESEKPVCASEISESMGYIKTSRFYTASKMRCIRLYKGNGSINGLHLIKARAVKVPGNMGPKVLFYSLTPKGKKLYKKVQKFLLTTKKES